MLSTFSVSHDDNVKSLQNPCMRKLNGFIWLRQNLFFQNNLKKKFNNTPFSHQGSIRIAVAVIASPNGLLHQSSFTLSLRQLNHRRDSNDNNGMTMTLTWVEPSTVQSSLIVVYTVQWVIELTIALYLVRLQANQYLPERNVKSYKLYQISTVCALLPFTVYISWSYIETSNYLMINWQKCQIEGVIVGQNCYNFHWIH
jgi:hypothetical protein